jgi:pimeloyl-ACP methyl ester carboxylesterase
VRHGEVVSDNDHDHDHDPFDQRFDVEVAGGSLHVARAGPPPQEAGTVVLAIHGITASLMAWRTLARMLPPHPDLCLLAPDLRGRGRSAALPEPYGIEAHVDDLVAVLDHVGVRRAVLVGHSLGGYIAARMAAEHPDRAAGIVLLDAGLPLPAPEHPEEMLRTSVGSAIMRLDITFPSADDYVAAWHAHPAFADAWDDDVEAYARYDLTEERQTAHCVASPAAVRADAAEMVLDNTTLLALNQVPAGIPIHVLRAARGLFDDPGDPVMPAAVLDAFGASHPQARVEHVADVNHYTLVMGASPGPARVLAAIRAVAS